MATARRTTQLSSVTPAVARSFEHACSLLFNGGELRRSFVVVAAVEFSFYVSHPSGICRLQKSKRKKDKTQINVAPRKSSDPSVRGAQSPRDGALSKGKTEGKKRKVHEAHYWATLSSASHAIHPSILAVRVSSTSSPSTNLPTPDSSRRRTKRLSQRGLLRSTRPFVRRAVTKFKFSACVSLLLEIRMACFAYSL